MAHGNADFYIEELQKIMGGRIIAGLKDENNEFFGLQIKKGKTTYNLWFLRDDEGNGPGSFEISK